MDEAVIEVPISIQLTTVPFKSLFTELELIISVETNGELARAEVLTKVNVVEFTLNSDNCTESSSALIKAGPYSVSLPIEFLAVKFHLTKVPLTVQVSSRGSPAWQTRATDPGNKVTVVPALQIESVTSIEIVQK